MSTEQFDMHSGQVAKTDGDFVSLVHPALILTVSFVTAGVVFLSGTELRGLLASETAILKLLGGAALLFALGVHFTQQLAARRMRSETEYVYRQTADDLEAMQKALTAHIHSHDRQSISERQ